MCVCVCNKILSGGQSAHVMLVSLKHVDLWVLIDQYTNIHYRGILFQLEFRVKVHFSRTNQYNCGKLRCIIQAHGWCSLVISSQLSFWKPSCLRGLTHLLSILILANQPHVLKGKGQRAMCHECGWLHAHIKDT